MKQTISLKQHKTMHVVNENLTSVTLGFQIPSNVADFSAEADTDSFHLDTFKDTFVTAVLKGQSAEPIRIYDNVSLHDIMLDHSKGKYIADNYKVKKSTDATLPKTYEGSIVVPFSAINLNGNEVLELDVRVNSVKLNTLADAKIETSGVSIEVATKHAVALQSAITTLERITLDDEYKKKYEISGNVVAVAFSQESLLGGQLDFIEAWVSSDIFETEFDLKAIMTNGVDHETAVNEKFMPLLNVTTALKNFEIEIKRAKLENSASYILVRKTVISKKAFTNYQAKQQRFKRQNMQRLVQN